MRSPVIAFSIIAATVSPVLVAGAPASGAISGDHAFSVDRMSEAATHHIQRSTDHTPIQAEGRSTGGSPSANGGSPQNPGASHDGHNNNNPSVPDTPNVPSGVPSIPSTPGGLPGLPLPVPDGAKDITGDIPLGHGGKKDYNDNIVSQNDPVHRTSAMKKAQAQAQAEQAGSDLKTPSPPAVPSATGKKTKRASDQYTAGGNAYSGAASDSSGGDVVNESTVGGTTNGDGSNNAGGAGSSFSGFAFGGNGHGHGPGGNAYTGATGASRGGSVVNSAEGGGAAGSDIDNTTANNAGGGGFSESGTAVGGNAARPFPDPIVHRRASDSGTAGGNAYSGATSDVSGGSVTNEADDDGTVTNDGGNTAGGAGTTFSGDADGGDGNGLGPGGNAYSGASGPAVGGTIYNYGGNIDNEADSNTAGGGGTSETGDATGGRA